MEPKATHVVIHDLHVLTSICTPKSHPRRRPQTSHVLCLCHTGGCLSRVIETLLVQVLTAHLSWCAGNQCQPQVGRNRARSDTSGNQRLGWIPVSNAKSEATRHNQIAARRKKCSLAFWLRSLPFKPVRFRKLLELKGKNGLHPGRERKRKRVGRVFPTETSVLRTGLAGSFPGS